VTSLRATVVVATHNRPAPLLECLEALAVQSASSSEYEVVVVDDASSELVTPVINKVEILDPLLNFSLIRLDQNVGMARARNAGIAEAHAPVILFIDDDAVPGPDWVDRMTTALEGGLDGVGGSWTPIKESRWADFDQGYSLLHYGEYNEKATGPGGQNMGYARVLLNRLGGFDPRFFHGADDADLNLRAKNHGAKLGFAPDSRVRHGSAQGLREFCQKRRVRGRATFDFHQKHSGPRAYFRGATKLLLTPLAIPLLLLRALLMSWKIRRPIRFVTFAILNLVDWILGSWGEMTAAVATAANWAGSCRGSISAYGRRNGLENYVRILRWGPRRRGRGPVTLLGPRFSRSYGRMMDEIHAALADASLLDAWFSQAYLESLHSPWILAQDRELDHPNLDLLKGNLRPRIILKRECPHIETLCALVSHEAKARGLNAPFINNEVKARALREYELADFFLVPSRFVRDSFIKSGVGPHRIGVVPCGVDHGRFRPSPLPTSGPRTLLFVGLMGLRKGVLHLLDAWMSLEPRSARLVLAGAMDESIRPLIESALERPGIEWVERPSDTRVVRLMAESHGFCLPSVADGFGLSALEAMASGRLVIVSDHCGASEHVPADGGHVVPADDRTALAAAIETFLSGSTVDLGEMGLRARNASLDLTWERYRSNVRSWITERVESEG